MARKLSQWNLFVKRIFAEGKGRNPNYQFKHALRDASTRKNEMYHRNVVLGSRKRQFRRRRTAKRRRH
jgi:hypothetical protein